MGFLLAISLLAAPGTAGAPDDPGTYLIVLGTTGEMTPLSRATNLSAQAPALREAQAHGGRIRYRYATVLNGFAADLTAEAVEVLRARDDVESVTPVSLVRPANEETVPFIGADVAWERYGLSGKGVTVAVIDSGIDYTHEVFGGPGTVNAYRKNDPDVVEPGTFPTSKVVGGYDFVGDDYDPTDKDKSNDLPEPDADPLDLQGHGSHVAGTCCGKGGSNVGKGVAFRSKILAYKVWGDGGASTSDVLVAAFEAAIDPNGDGDTSDRADVVSLSGGVTFGTADSVESLAAQRVIEAGSVFVAAAGNSGGEQTGSTAYVVGAPATAPDAIAVAATSVPDDRIAGFSSQGPARFTSALKPDISAPGQAVRSAAAGTGDGATVIGGTSMATPHISGAAALLLERRPRTSPERVKTLLMNRASPEVVRPGGSGIDVSLSGAGRIDLAGALKASFAVTAPSVSFGVVELPVDPTERVVELQIANMRKKAARFKIFGSRRDRYAGASRIVVSRDADSFHSRIGMNVEGRSSRSIWVKAIFRSDALSEADVARRWYGKLIQTFGFIEIKRRGTKQVATVPWHAVLRPVSQVSAALSETGSVIFSSSSSGIGPSAEIYPFATADPAGDNLFPEADIRAIGVRSFTGTFIGDGPESLPSLLDPLRHNGWIDYVQGGGLLDEPVSFVVATAGMHEILSTMTVRIYVDTGGDGIYVDDELRADHVIEKEYGDASGWCVRDLLFDDGCSSYRGAFPMYLSHATGVVVDAAELGLSDETPEFSFRIEACSDGFSGDVFDPVCDEAGSTAPGAPAFSATGSGAELEHLGCGGFWYADACDEVEWDMDPGLAQVLVIYPEQSAPAHQLLTFPGKKKGP